MRDVYRVSPALAWQSYDCIDLLIVLDRKSNNFYFFQETGRFIVEQVLQRYPVHEIIKKGRDSYEVSDNDLILAVSHFVELLLREGLINEFDSDI